MNFFTMKIKLLIAFVILTVTSVVVYESLDTKFRFILLQNLGIKNSPAPTSDSMSVIPVVVGIPYPYHLAIIGDDIFFNQRFTGKLYVVMDGSFSPIPKLNLNLDNPDIQIKGITNYKNHLFLHTAEYDSETKTFDNHKIYDYLWDGLELSFVNEIKPIQINTDQHHHGAISVGNDGQVFTTYPESTDYHTGYFEYGIHGFKILSEFSRIWHSTEVNPDLYFPSELPATELSAPSEEFYEKIHSVNISDFADHLSWDVPYYPNSIEIVLTPSTTQGSLYVGTCKDSLANVGIFKYPVDFKNNEFLITDFSDDFLSINHKDYMILNNLNCVSDIEFKSSSNELFFTDNVSNGAIYKILLSD